LRHLYLIAICLFFSCSVAFAQKTDSIRVNIYTPSDTGENRIFVSVQSPPEFHGGKNAFYRFLAHTIRYPPEARTADIQGKVIIHFIVEKDGSLSRIQVVKGIGGGCDEEAARVMKLSPKWNPGMQNGRPVRVSYIMPISFTLSQ
jgi:periplasmic protein TonB